MDSTRDDDNEQEFAIKLLAVDYQETILLAAVHCHAQYENKQRQLFYSHRSPSLFDQRLHWDNFCTCYGHCAKFKWHIRIIQYTANLFAFTATSGQ
jgi:hypothetical protein